MRLILAVIIALGILPAPAPVGAPARSSIRKAYPITPIAIRGEGLI